MPLLHSVFQSILEVFTQVTTHVCTTVSPPVSIPVSIPLKNAVLQNAVFLNSWKNILKFQYFIVFQGQKIGQDFPFIFV